MGQVDILSQGKQCVVKGIHPDTGQQYYWPEASLLDASLTDVPLITEERVDAFVRLVGYAEPKLSANAKAVRDHVVAVAVKAAAALPARLRSSASSGSVLPGQRNNHLFSELRKAASGCANLPTCWSGQRR